MLMLDGPVETDGERSSAELETLDNGEHSMTEIGVQEDGERRKKAELKTPRKEKQAGEVNASLTNCNMVVTSLLISRGPLTGIADADMRIISHEITKAQAWFDNEDNNDT